MTSTSGYVYCLTIPRMDGVVKIGYTLKTMEERMKSLDNTSVVEPFQLYYAGKVNNPKRVESLIHSYFKSSRIRSNREFFEVNPLDVRRLIEIAEASSDITPQSNENISDQTDIEYQQIEPDPEENISDDDKSTQKEQIKQIPKEETDNRFEKFKYRKKQ